MKHREQPQAQVRSKGRDSERESPDATPASLSEFKLARTDDEVRREMA